MKEYIDHLGLVINLTDGSSFEVELLTAKSKADGFIVKMAYSNLNHVIAILDSWKAKKDAEERAIEDKSTDTIIDIPTEIRKYKQLMDDGILTQG
ncbi:hypothetical protein PT285_06330 [Lactobacillus sp. ESL0791]|uniref:hypothetical protein n=1 Tax=Lactobacillus sp. ESL0791 TaxID=2983234 RepID=UPI0023F83DDF|nr:hypothetical protein [Lactobacillus sp. ESL0791]MDF7639017.1 hypothetical protein [Lactobacillus sp. ESL0791]